MFANSIATPFYDDRGDQSPVTDPLRRLRPFADESAEAGSGESAPAALAPIVSATPAVALRQSVAAVPARQTLVEHGGMRVFYAHASQAPVLLREIGRLRELTFREVGEGTGRAIDLDAFDQDYLHLVLWDEAAGEVAGAYRLGLVDQILAERGQRGLYTDTLFALSPELLEALDGAVEMGRSFVQPAYQRKFTSLLLLWQGIGAFLARYPRYHTLFGGVSISNSYSAAAQQLMVAHLMRHHAHDTLHAMPRHRVTTPVWRWRVAEALATLPADVDALNQTVAELDGGTGVPVLIRQYLKLGGRFLGFNRDPDFADAIDGLILVDMRQAPDRMRAKFMGREAADRFMANGTAPTAAKAG